MLWMGFGVERQLDGWGSGADGSRRGKRIEQEGKVKDGKEMLKETACEKMDGKIDSYLGGMVQNGTREVADSNLPSPVRDE